MVKKHKKSKQTLISRLIWKPNSELDIAGYDFSFWKVIAVAAVFLCLLVNKLFVLPTALEAFISWAAFFIAVVPVLYNLYLNLRQGKILSDVLIMTVAALLILFTAGVSLSAILLALYNSLRLFETVCLSYTHGKTFNAFDMMPEYATVICEGIAEKRKPSRIRKGDYIGVKTGELIPVDGVIIDGYSSVNYSPLTQVSCETLIKQGDEVLSGGINVTNPIIIQATKDYAQSMMQKIVSFCTDTLKSETKEESLLYIVLQKSVPVVFVLSLIISLFLPLLTGKWSTCAHRAFLLLLLCCPLGIYESISNSAYSAVQKIFNAGAVIRTKETINDLSVIGTIICNKTSTITEDEYIIEDVCPKGISIDNFISLVLKVESISNSPIAKALRRYVDSEELLVPENMQAVEIPCRGIRANVSGTRVLVGNALLLHENGIECLLPDKTGTCIHVAVNDDYCGYIVLSNKVRQGCSDAIESIRALGVQQRVLLSSDLLTSVRGIANSLGFNISKAEIDSADKASAAEYLVKNKQERTTVAYLGNGIDELEPASNADIAITTEALAVPEALNSGDVSILGTGLPVFPNIVKAAKSYRRISLAALSLFAVIRLAVLVMFFFVPNAVKLPAIIVFLGSFVTLALSSYIFDKF